MKSAVATRFRCRRPSSNLEQCATMFLTLIFQYLNKLVEGKIGDFTSPQAFHAVKVQGFNGDCVEPLTKFRGELPLKIFALVGDFPIQACELPHTPPPPVRTSYLSGKAFVERPKFVQVRFQRLWVLFFLTRAKCHIRVFHAEVCPNAFTCCQQRFRFYKVGYDIKPIIATRVPLDRDMTDISIKLTVFMKRIRDFIISPFTVVPFSKGECDTILFQRPACLFKCDRLELVSFLDFWSTAKFLEKSHIRCINASEFFLNRLARQGVPMRVCRPFQRTHVRTHSSITPIWQSLFISLTVPLMEVVMHLPHIVKQVAKAYRIRLITKLILIGLHDISHITPLSACTVGRQTRYQAVTLCMSASVIVLIRPQFVPNVKFILGKYAISRFISQT